MWRKSAAKSSVLPTRSQAIEPRPNFIIMNKNLTPLMSVIAGICVLIFPALLNYVVGIYLILTGLLAFQKS